MFRSLSTRKSKLTFHPRSFSPQRNGVATQVVTAASNSDNETPCLILVATFSRLESENFSSLGNAGPQRRFHVFAKSTGCTEGVLDPLGSIFCSLLLLTSNFLSFN